VFTLPLAFSTIRESDSIIRARSGQIVVIGGLMQDLQRDDGAGIPLLMKIPYLGRLFRHELDAMRKVELVILLRATVVEEGTWAERLEETAERLEKLSPGARDSLGADWLEPTP
jgi:MSHA biogenesis protein MshL